MLSLQSADTLRSKNRYTHECLTHAHAIDDTEPLNVIKLLQEIVFFSVKSLLYYFD